MKFILKTTLLFRAIDAMYATQYRNCGDYQAKVRALHSLLKQRGII